MGAPHIVLLDNGSLKPAAVRALRATAAALAGRTGRAVTPVSLLHSHKIPVADLEVGDRVEESRATELPTTGSSARDVSRQPETQNPKPETSTSPGAAPILEPWLKQQAAAGAREFLVVPYFLGPSRALTEYLPARVAKLRALWPDLVVRVAAPLGAGEAAAAGRLAAVLEERVRAVLAALPAGDQRPAVAVVDHGSPEPAVTVVRDAVAEQLRVRLGPAVHAVAPCSMERREGDEFAFTDPLLAALLDREPFDRGVVIVAMLFLSPGRHAGPEGDVATICREAEGRHPGLQVTMTELLGGHPQLVEMLAERLARTLHTSP